jgi:hypothetical protein
LVTAVKVTKKIITDLLERWRAGKPGAAAELLFETGLWDELLKGVSESQRDAAEDGILRALDELRRRKEPLSLEKFIEAFPKQARRRAKDLIIKQIEWSEGLSLDRPWINSSEDDGEVPRIEYLRAKEREASPEYSFCAERAIQLTIKLLKAFSMQLSNTFQRHLQAVEQALEALEPQALAEERTAMLLEFLHVGRTHRKELADLVIQACCGSRDTYDSAHNWRLRRAWRKFINNGGAGHEDFELLVQLGSALSRWSV